MLTLDTTMTFFGISILLGLSPGPDNLFVLMQSATNGRKAGLLVTLGLWHRLARSHSGSGFRIGCNIGSFSHCVHCAETDWCGVLGLFGVGRIQGACWTTALWFVTNTQSLAHVWTRCIDEFNQPQGRNFLGSATFVL